MKNVKIKIENGISIDGYSLSENNLTIAGELVFTTVMAGYQEIITDPSFAGQIVVMTYPLIGNYGVDEKFNQSNKIYAKGIIVSSLYSDDEFLNFCSKNKLPVFIFDTRNLVHLIRDLFYPKCIISSEELSKHDMNMYYNAINTDLVPEVSTKNQYCVNGFAENNKKIAVFDFGIKLNIIEELKSYFSEIIILPHNSSFEKIKSLNPDAVLLSNGPGNPDVLFDIIDTIKQILGKFPLFGICLGHQLLALALNCKTKIMNFGHRGGNHPVINVETGKIIITSQNHGYEIIESSMNSDILVTHRNIHDNSIEGVKSEKYNARSVQFHPESSPGPLDANVIFKEWFSIFKNE